MSATSQVVIARALGPISVALEAGTGDEALRSVRDETADLEPDLARRVASYLVMQLVWRQMPRRSRSAMREWVAQEWVRVMQSPVVLPLGVLAQGGDEDAA